jgi:hypothetical protein
MFERSTANIVMQLMSGNANNAGINFGDTDDINIGQLRYDHATDKMAFVTNNSDRMTIDSTGNVGIKNTAPNTTLHLGGVAGTDGIRFPDGTLQTTAASSTGPGTVVYVTGSTSGACTAGSWQTRVLDQEVSDSGNLATVASNQVTLAAGTYWCEAEAPAFYVGSHQARLYNVSDAAVVGYGASEYSGRAAISDSAQTKSVVKTLVTLPSAKTLRIEHQCQTSHGTGFGQSISFGGTMHYATLTCRKL